MSKLIKVNLFDIKSLNRVIEEIKEYKDDLNKKCALFVRRLAETGIPVIDENINSAEGDSNKRHNTYIKINSFGDYSQARLIVEGRDILFIEFGSGIHYNGKAGSSPHPKGNEFGYTIGSYGKGLGKNDSWAYIADTGETVISHGTQATMPVYKAGLEIRRQILKIAKEVFGGD